MTCGLVHAIYRLALPEWQAVKLTFFARQVKHTPIHARLNIPHGFY